ncbi:hypothetical protein bcgnr5378_29880 [Bacillus cereus]|uniref:Uncharacterized protein n=1 Tax=Bacillus cereus TaxID=1396 RepID=A0A162PIH7_BACCE|nr:hypothetical protein [Bacillus cereus]KZD72125.1 hypothetical protein B4088_0586 [Bacillus cereus]HDR8322663.1 hypothetical protein [Bacillus cereus]HDR8330330.1 hypothetical protein [Bacillus cereus]HDR8332964.1 hypothetical protein [Bacillus cereus]
MENKITPTKPTKKRRKLSKSQEAKKKVLFEKFKNQWTYAKLSYGDEDRYCFLFHRPKDGNSISKVEQVLVSGDMLVDGVYDIQDYSLEEAFNCKTKKDIITIFMRKFDLAEGKYKDKTNIKNKDDLKKYLIEKGFLSEELFEDFFTHNRIPKGMNLTEVRIDFERF